MEAMQIHSQVGTDGILRLEIPLGPEDAGADVLVTIESAPSAVGQSWGGFLSETFGGPEPPQPVVLSAVVRPD